MDVFKRKPTRPSAVVSNKKTNQEKHLAGPATTMGEAARPSAVVTNKKTNQENHLAGPATTMGEAATTMGKGMKDHQQDVNSYIYLLNKEVEDAVSSIVHLHPSTTEDKSPEAILKDVAVVAAISPLSTSPKKTETSGMLYNSPKTPYSKQPSNVPVKSLKLKNYNPEKSNTSHPPIPHHTLSQNKPSLKEQSSLVCKPKQPTLPNTLTPREIIKQEKEHRASLQYNASCYKKPVNLNIKSSDASKPHRPILQNLLSVESLTPQDADHALTPNIQPQNLSANHETLSFITKNPPVERLCQHILLKGSKKGAICGKRSIETFCKIHAIKRSTPTKGEKQCQKKPISKSKLLRKQQVTKIRIYKLDPTKQYKLIKYGKGNIGIFEAKRQLYQIPLPLDMARPPPNNNWYLAADDTFPKMTWKKKGHGDSVME